MKGYVPLHLHTDRDSVLDSMVKATRASKKETSLITQRAVEYHMPAMAITGHGYMCGAVEHYKNCIEAGIKPIIGFEAYITTDMHIKDTSSKYYHLILLAKNEVGYRNLKILSSKGALEGFYNKPRIDFELLKQHSDGVIVLTACLASELDRMIMSDDYNEFNAYDLIEKYRDVFGDDYYIEIQSSRSPDQIKVNKELVRLAEEMDVKYVVTTDVHFVDRDDFDAHSVYVSIKKSLETENYRYCYLQTRQEILDILTPQIGAERANIALDNTFEVADKCNLEIELHNPKLPHMDIPEEFSDDFEWLKHNVYEGLKQKGLYGIQKYMDRVEMELEVIHCKDFQGYFLILQKIIDLAKERGIPIGEGRGSAAGCLCTYCLGITNVDSVKYDLDFGRFLTVERTENPDVDVDVSTARRGELIDLIVEYFGYENVAQVLTFGSLASKEVLNSVGKSMEVPKEVIEMLKQKLKDGVGVNGLKNESEYKNYKDYIDVCCKLEGSVRSYGCHAGAVCIAGDNKPITEYAPVMLNKAGRVMTQFEMHDTEDCNLVKYDMLGLSSLDYIADCLELIGSSYYDYEFDYEDKATFETLSNGDTVGCFQTDSEFAKRVITSVKPQTISEIADCVAIGRPDAVHFLEAYVEGKFGHSKQKEIHPDLTKILSRTYGCMIYQEQLMNIFKVFGGFSDGQADKVRKIVGKKKLDDLPQQLDLFRRGATERGYSNEVIDEVIAFIKDNVSYSFNMAHAVAYGITTFKTAYLRTHYPTEYMAAVINNQKTEEGSPDYGKIKAYISACKNIGIEVVNVDINSSTSYFTPDPEQNKIYFGFGLVKGLSSNGIKTITECRPFVSYKDFLGRVGLTLAKGDVLALIKSGSFNNLCDRDKMELFKHYYLLRFKNKKEEVSPIAKVNKNHVKWLLDNGYVSPEQQEDREYCTEVLNKVRKKMGWQQFFDKYCSGSEEEWEMETLSCHIHSRPFEDVKIPDWNKVGIDSKTYTGGVLTSVKEVTTKKGKSAGSKMCFLNLDYYGTTLDLVVFPNTYLKLKPILKAGACVCLIVTKQGELKGVVDSGMTLQEYRNKYNTI